MIRRDFMKLIGAVALAPSALLMSDRDVVTKSIPNAGVDSSNDGDVWFLYGCQRYWWYQLGYGGTKQEMEKALKEHEQDWNFLIIGTKPKRLNGLLRINVEVSTKWT